MTTLDLAAHSGELVDALVSQKDALRVAINNASYEKDLRAAGEALALLAPVWKATGYGYKIAEIRSLIVSRAESLIAEEEDYLKPLRKNAATRSSTERHIKFLNILIRELKDA